MASWKLLDNSACRLSWRLFHFYLLEVLIIVCLYVVLCQYLLRFTFFISGLAFTLSHERVALLITTVYSVYCAWTYVGWLGLLFGLNLSFISSDILIYFLKNNINQSGRPDRSPEQAPGMQGQPGFSNGDQVHASSSETGAGFSADRGPGVPSTSGTDSEMTSEDEVVRLLNCTDHYSALGLSRFEDVDISLLKREYRKKVIIYVIVMLFYLKF